jgi:hypothetical protein
MHFARERGTDAVVMDSSGNVRPTPPTPRGNALGEAKEALIPFRRMV